LVGVLWVHSFSRSEKDRGRRIEEICNQYRVSVLL
jgi:hypothetical protein